MEEQELVRECCEWEINNLKVAISGRELKVELDKLGLTYIYKQQQEIDVIRIGRKNKGRCNDMDRIFFQK
jgi:hypothetical protein